MNSNAAAAASAQNPYFLLLSRVIVRPNRKSSGLLWHTATLSLALHGLMGPKGVSSYNKIEVMTSDRPPSSLEIP